jgi:hypothetical protein
MIRVALFFVVVTALWSVDAALGLGVFWEHDLRHHHIPWRIWAAGEWAGGRVPLYSPSVGNGFALGADGQTGVFYLPTMLLFAWLKPAVAVNASILGHILLAVMGMQRLMHSLGHRGAGAVLAAIAFAFSGFMAAHTGYLGMQNAVAWLPLLLVGVVRGRWAQTGLCAAFMMVAGHPQMAVIGLVLAASISVWKKTFRLFLVGLLVALIAASPQILATAELLGQSMRAGGVDTAFSRIGILPVAELINGVLPEFFGFERPADMVQTYFHRGGGYWGSGANHWESAFYLGLPVVILAFFGLVRQRFLAGVCVVSVLLMVASPLWSLLGLLPIFDAMRFPVRFSLVLTIGVAILAGIGLNRAIVHPQLDKISGRIGAFVGLFAIALAIGGTLFSGRRAQIKSFLELRFQAREHGPSGLLSGENTMGPSEMASRVEQILNGAAEALNPMSAPNLWAMGIVAAVALLFWMRGQKRLSASTLAMALIGLSYIDLWHFGAGYTPTTPTEAFYRTPAVVARLGDAIKEGRYGVVDRRRHPRLDKELLSSNIGIQYGLQDVLVPSPLMNVRNEALLKRVGLDVGERGPQKWSLAANNLNIISMMGVRWLFSEHAPPDNMPAAWVTHMRTPIVVVENKLALPREYLVGCVEVTDDPWAALDTLDPRVNAISAKELGLPICAQPIQNARLEVRESGPTHREYAVSTQGPALFVQIETHMPGWVATVDGVVTEIHRVNWNFRGIVLEPGSHIIKLRYAPRWLSAALPLGGLAWMAMFFGLSRRESEPEAEE